MFNANPGGVAQIDILEILQYMHIGQNHDPH